PCLAGLCRAGKARAAEKIAAAADAKSLILCLNPICLRRRIGRALDSQALALFCDLFLSYPADARHQTRR
ncbi:hypothetical protein, partial [Rhizobium leguminosarum]|uniref:hypothetical protein n=1 Tax=Rhizobium leguminosarum TaxID=384 RepID=UPI003F94DCD1